MRETTASTGASTDSVGSAERQTAEDSGVTEAAKSSDAPDASASPDEPGGRSDEPDGEAASSEPPQPATPAAGGETPSRSAAGDRADTGHTATEGGGGKDAGENKGTSDGSAPAGGSASPSGTAGSSGLGSSGTGYSRPNPGGTGSGGSRESRGTGSTSPSPGGAGASGNPAKPLGTIRSPQPTYTRPPGMTPPPDRLDEDAVAKEATIGVPASAVLSSSVVSTSGSYPVVSSVAPVSSPPRVTGRASAAGATIQPAGPNNTATATATATATSAAVGAARVAEAPRPVVEPAAARPRPAATPRGPRRARLGVKRIDPWSVMKFSFAVSLVLFIVVIVAASVLYLALDTMGVFESINNTIAELVDAGGGESGDTFRITAQGVIGTAAVLGALNVLLFTSLATLGAFIYNVCADLVGGVEVTLAERD